ncbi:MAG TPA: UvrD-helicase domain-containing protein [Longimicrobium sp.]|uniref:ATP-dependent helicase n=1 Tax=Longimicrobium sp. TaxID=2029185 RepID=UPI002ED8DB8C
MQAIPQYLLELNPEQRQAALATEGPVLVLAGAGSGKTRTLVYRIAHLIRDKGIHPRAILAVTFTNKAAAEMRERVAKMVGREAKGIVLSTFHSLGARLLRDYGDRLGMPKDFSIYPTGDQIQAIKRIMAEEIHISATVGEDAYDPKKVLFTIGDWKNRLITPEQAKVEVAEGQIRGDRRDDYAVLAADVYPRYEQTLRAAGACDFDDLLVLPVQLLREHMEVREKLWKRWRYLMVDEYQDTNGAQFEMARLMAGPLKNLCVVGDDDQSIYAWRGADVRNILDFERHYPGAQVVILEENYRSTQRILDAANGVIANNTTRKAKRLRTSNGPGPKIDYWNVGEEGGKTAEEREAEMVAREIGVRRWNEKLSWGDFAVLYRTNLQAKPVEEALRAANIPYRVIGGQSFFDRKEVADLVAYLRVVLNPKDEVSLRRILNYPTRGIGRTSMMRLIDAARAAQQPIYEALKRVDPVDGVNRGTAEAVRAFVEMMEELRLEFHATQAAIDHGITTQRTLVGFVRELVKRVRLEEAVRADNAKSEKAAAVRVEILREFVESVARFEERTWKERPPLDEEDDWDPPALRAFLERVSLTDEEDKKDKDDENPDLVTLMTMHSAKGLEFPHVFIIGLEEEILPHTRSMSASAAAEADAEEAWETFELNGGTDPIAEERRLFYVGITRARHRLTLSGCATRRQRESLKPRKPSRFLSEISPDLLEQRAGALTASSSLTPEESQNFRKNIFANLREQLQGGA